MAKPTYPAWIPNNTTNILTPPGGQLTIGWLPLQKPPSQYFNWFFNLISQWVNFTGPGAPTVIVGSEAYCTHATLAAAVADSGVGTNIRVLLVDSAVMPSSPVALTKAGWIIEALPGVSYSDPGGGLGGLSAQAAGIEIRSLRMVGFTTAIAYTSTGTYGRVLFCNFNGCNTDVDDSAAPAGKKPVSLGNIDE